MVLKAIKKKNMTGSFKPEVDQASEFLEISSDFGDPKEVIREAISNSFDAHAKEIKIKVYIDKSSGEDELVLNITDDGDGMGIDELKKFFNLGSSNRRDLDQFGNKRNGAIGEKGHGTKIYYNSRQVEVITSKGTTTTHAFLDEARKKLMRGIIPDVFYDTSDNGSEKGTSITIRGYNNNDSKKFSHDELRDYIYWFTRFGSFEMEIGDNSNKDLSLWLLGLGYNNPSGETLKFGHPFPKVRTDIRDLKTSDKVWPLDHYVAKWSFPHESVIGIPNSHIDFVFYIEGDSAKRRYNPMIHQSHAKWMEGQYNVEERYGLWLCKDFIPIQRENSWVSEKSEFTKYHSFVNCQNFKLTANRGDIGNTPAKIKEGVENTVKKIFKEQIEPTQLFEKYKKELEKQQSALDAQKEEKDFERRRRATLSKKVAKFHNVELFEPRLEAGVFSLILQILTLEPDIFGFKVIDYDTSIGYDLLVTKDQSLDLNRASMMFVEIKQQLQREFNHSFAKLASIICWDTGLYNDAEVEDIKGEKRKIKITARSQENGNDYTKYMLVSDTEPLNIEVFVLKEFLKDKLNLHFSTRTNS